MFPGSGWNTWCGSVSSPEFPPFRNDVFAYKTEAPKYPHLFLHMSLLYPPLAARWPYADFRFRFTFV